MLVEFTVANYRSFREPVTLSLEAEPRLSERDKAVDAKNVVETPHGPLLRVAGVYGANASGKSNLVKALSLMRWMVQHTAREGQAGDLLPVRPFGLDDASIRAPTELEVVFLLDGRQVRYGLAAVPKEVRREWLYVTETGGAEVLGFERDGSTYETGPAWVRDEALEAKTRTGALHLSVAAAFAHGLASEVLGWFQRLRVIDGADDVASLTETIALLDDPVYAAAIKSLVRRLDLGVDEVFVQDLPAMLEQTGHTFASDRMRAVMSHPLSKVVTVHRVDDLRSVTLRLAEESAGTAKLISQAGPIVDTLLRGSVLVIDELDARLHTLLALELVRLFQDPLTNPHDAQLVFASHDTNLLTRSLLRRDQLWFVEKSHKTQASDLYSLAEFRLPDGRRVRNDASYEADYLQGRYGAIPFFGNLHELLGEALVASDGGPADE